MPYKKEGFPIFYGFDKDNKRDEAIENDLT